MGRHEEIVKLLLEKGASTEIDPEAEVRYPLHWVILNGREKSLSLVKLLVEHRTDKDLEDGEGATAVARAVAKENLDIISYLLEKGARTALSTQEGGTTSILHWSTYIRSTPEKSLAVARLILKHGADVNFRVFTKETPIHTATRNRNLEVMKLILQNGGSIDAQEFFGRTPLIVAINIMRLILHDQSEVLKLLFGDAADKMTEPTSSYPDVHSGLDQELTKAIELLIASGADINVKKHRKWSPLNSAAAKGHENIVELLLDHGADVKNRTENAWTPVLNAANEGHENIIKLLLAHGAELNVFDDHGWTALHSAAREGKTYILEYLVSAGIKADEIDESGDTALHVAATMNEANTS